VKKYYEYENIIYRADAVKGMKTPIVEAQLVGGKWKPCAGSEATAARTWGNPMTEEEAREFHGKGWPAEAKPA